MQRRPSMRNAQVRLGDGARPAEPKAEPEAGIKAEPGAEPSPSPICGARNQTRLRAPSFARPQTNSRQPNSRTTIAP